jgi:hypothetical protein
MMLHKILGNKYEPKWIKDRAPKVSMIAKTRVSEKPGVEAARNPEFEIIC